MSDSHAAAQLDLASVEDYLAANLPGFKGPIEAEKFSRGQSNPTFLLKASSGNYVLRRKPPGVLLKSAHAVDREFWVQSALAGSEVPVSKMHILCSDDAVTGSMFYVMDFVPGRNFVDPRLQDLSNEQRSGIFDEMNRVIAALHQVDPATVGLDDYGPPGNYFERQIARWSKQYRASETETIEPMDALIDELIQREAFDDGQRTLVHGDYRIDNMMFDGDGTSCLAVLDWELSTLGHPYADLASMIMQWHMPPGEEGRGLAGVDRVALGIPTDEQFVEAYCKRRSITSIDSFGYCLAFCFFRMAAVIQGVKKRALDGNASNPERALKMGEFVKAFAHQGLKALS
ncbi:phosphotransferase family protein [Alphaproteobacteria bacterium]|nr:phosphotransferase family protein [Alphaproteobacteria bacterium]